MRLKYIRTYILKKRRLFHGEYGQNTNTKYGGLRILVPQFEVILKLYYSSSTIPKCKDCILCVCLSFWIWSICYVFEI